MTRSGLARASNEALGIRDAGHGFDLFGANARWILGAQTALSPLYRYWFRVDSHGAENIPKTGPAIIAANHGGTLPFDATMLWADVFRKTHRVLRPVADHFVLGLPFIGTLAARTGAVGGTRENVRCLLEQGELLLVFPEGTPGVAKNFGRRYHLCPFRVGHAEFSIRHRAPVVPAAVVGAEEQMPQITTLPIRLFGAPHLPLPVTPLPLPVRYHIRYGTPLLLYQDYPPEAADDPEVLDRAAMRVQASVRSLIHEELRARRGVFR